MLSTVVAIALLCSPREPSSWHREVGKFTVEFKLEDGRLLSLRDGSGVKWSQRRPELYESQVRVADDGTMVIEDARQGSVEVIGIDGKSRGIVDVAAQLTEDEKERLPFSSCGRSYFSSLRTEGSQLLIEVPLGGNRRPTEPAGPALTITVDLASLKTSRPSPPPMENSEALIARFHAATTDLERQAAIGDLVTRARHANGKGDRALLGLCREWAEGKEGPDRASDGVTCVASAGSDADVDALASLPASKADSQILSALENHKRPKRFDYALRLLSEHREPDLLRSRAVAVACTATAPDSFKAARIAVADPSPRVRSDASYRISEWGAGETGFELLSTLATDADAEVRDRSRERLLSRYLGTSERDFERDFVELVTHGKLESWGAGWIVLGGIDEVHGKSPNADYEKGLKLYGDTLPHHGSAELALWAEAKLRLAQLALDGGDKKRAKALAEEVVKAGANGDVQAPKPNRFSGYTSSSGVTIRSPSSAAQEILDLVSGKAKKKKR